MDIKKILISQPVPTNPEKSPFTELARKYKVSVDYRPLISVQGISLKEFRSQKVDVLSHTAVVFTGRTTIDSFFKVCEESRISIPETMKYFCSTETIALYLQKYIVYRKRKIFFSDGNPGNLTELISKHREENFLLALSEPHTNDLPKSLEELDIRFSRLILARTVPADLTGTDISDYGLVLCYSPADISSLLSSFPKDRVPMIATFGTKTTTAARNEGLSVTLSVPTPECPSMVKAADIILSEARSRSSDQTPRTKSRTRSSAQAQSTEKA